MASGGLCPACGTFVGSEDWEHCPECGAGLGGAGSSDWDDDEDGDEDDEDDE